MANNKLPNIERDKLQEKEAPLEAYSWLEQNYFNDVGLKVAREMNESFLKRLGPFQPGRKYSIEEGNKQLNSSNRVSKEAELSTQQAPPPLSHVEKTTKLLEKFGKFGTLSQETKAPAATQAAQKQKNVTPKK